MHLIADADQEWVYMLNRAQSAVFVVRIIVQQQGKEALEYATGTGEGSDETGGSGD